MKKTRFRNGIRHSAVVRERARQLRHDGAAHREIAKELGTSVSTAHLWTKDITLSAEQRVAILARAARHAFSIERRKKLSEAAKIRLAKYRERYTKADLLNKITDFYRRYGRIPLKREFNMYDTYRRHFGSWNSAIRAAGFNTNPQIFSYKFFARDGHRCDSFTERIIDDWLSERNISHERNWKYLGTKMTADFFVQPGIVIEFFGLAGVQKRYNELIEAKRGFCAGRGLVLIGLYPYDVFPEDHLNIKLGFLQVIVATKTVFLV